ncbi:endoribonuclease ysh1 [Tulasnella sp. 331]|nr:endoribonuclease ysh1 [Tulasnella sp. 331]
MNSAETPTLSITMLGAGQEVGRSCCVLQYRGRTIVCDAGVHPALSGMASLPFVDELDWSTVDALLVTHFHLDHAASLTYIMEKTNFKDGKGKVYMTHATKAIHKYMMQDFIRMRSASISTRGSRCNLVHGTFSSSGDPLFTALDLSLSFPLIIPVAAHQQISPCPGVTFIPYHAGHVLGACMFLIDIAGIKILYTGDYSREEDRHLVKAEVPSARPDVLIIESTYGVQSLEARPEKEAMFTSDVHAIIRRGGHVLLPVFAMGRAQELLLILDEYWDQHPELHNVPIYYASSLARKCMSVYQTYIHTMNANIKGRFERRDNPFVFKYISNLPHARSWEKKVAEGGPCVVLASPGFLHTGASRELLELWAPDSRNGLIITGYSVEGTMARDILTEPEEITGLKGNTIPRRISVRYISFSAHVDYSQNAEFIDLISPQHIVLVHGEQTAMGRLRGALQSKYKDRDEDVKVYTPRNLETLQLTFRGERIAKAIGTLATEPPAPNSILSGLLVAKDYSYTLLDPKDLKEFTGLSTSSVIQKVRIAIGCGWELVRWHMEGMYGAIIEGRDKGGMLTLRIMSAVDVKWTSDTEVTLEWVASASNDMVADSVIAILMSIDQSPASVKMTTHSHSHTHEEEAKKPSHIEVDVRLTKSHPHAPKAQTSRVEELAVLRMERITMFLEAHFGDVQLRVPEGVKPDAAEGEEVVSEEFPAIAITLDDSTAEIRLLDMMVRSSNEALRKRVVSVLQMALATTGSLAEQFVSVDHSAIQESDEIQAIMANVEDDSEGGVKRLAEDEGDREEGKAIAM